MYKRQEYSWRESSYNLVNLRSSDSRASSAANKLPARVGLGHRPECVKFDELKNQINEINERFENTNEKFVSKCNDLSTKLDDAVKSINVKIIFDFSNFTCVHCSVLSIR